MLERVIRFNFDHDLPNKMRIFQTFCNLKNPIEVIPTIVKYAI